MRARATIAAISVVLVTLALPTAGLPASGSAEDRVYFDITLKLNSWKMESTAAGLGAVADAYYDVCRGVTDIRTAMSRIQLRGRARWIKSIATILLEADRLKGVDSPCTASVKYRSAQLHLNARAQFLWPNCTRRSNPFCAFESDFRRRLVKVERRLWFDYCRLSLWSRGTGIGLAPIVIKYSPSSGCL